VFHVGANGYVSGPGAGARFPAGRTNGLLDAWLRVKASDIDYPLAPKSIRIDVPRISDGEISYFTEELERLPYGMLPIIELDTETHSVRGGWPHPSQRFSTKSPDAESERVFGPFVWAEDDGVPIGINVAGNHRTLPLQAKWPGPLGLLIRPADGVDIMLGQQEMAAIARQSVEDSKGAQLEAVRRAAAHVFSGHTTEEKTWFLPLLAEQGERRVLFEAEDRGFEAGTLSELTSNAAFRKKMSTKVAIQRPWGPLGLFWTLLVEHLENNAGFQVCKRCGGLIQGKLSKQFCGKHDNASCFNTRRARDQRKSRRKNRART
jgi:hypothetical protein